MIDVQTMIKENICGTLLPIDRWLISQHEGSSANTLYFLLPEDRTDG